MPAASMRCAQTMLLRSSKRAFSSTSTATCLPASAASISMSTSGEFAPMRYSVILMAMTCGSRTAARRNASTDAKESNGWCTRWSRSRTSSKMESRLSSDHSGRGENGASFSFGRGSRARSHQCP